MAPLPQSFIRAVVAAIAPAITQRLTVAMMRSPTFHRAVARAVHHIDHLPARLTEGKPIPPFKGPPVIEPEQFEKKFARDEDYGEPHDMEDPFSTPKRAKRIEAAQPEFAKTFRRAFEEERAKAEPPKPDRLAEKKKPTRPPPDDTDWYIQMKRMQDKMRDE